MRILFKRLKKPMESKIQNQKIKLSLLKNKIVILMKNPRLWYPQNASKKSDKRRKRASLKSLSKQQVKGAWSFQVKEVRTSSACSAT